MKVLFHLKQALPLFNQLSTVAHNCEEDTYSSQPQFIRTYLWIEDIRPSEGVFWLLQNSQHQATPSSFLLSVL